MLRHSLQLWFREKFKFHNLKTRLPPSFCPHRLTRGVAAPARPPGPVPPAPIKARGAFDEADRDQWNRGRGLNWLCYRRGGQLLETAGNGDQWLLGVISTFICMKRNPLSSRDTELRSKVPNWTSVTAEKCFIIVCINTLRRLMEVCAVVSVRVSCLWLKSIKGEVLNRRTRHQYYDFIGIYNTSVVLSLF